MIKLTVNEKEYSYPNGYKEVTLERFIQIQDFLYSEHNKKWTEILTNPKKKVKKKEEEDVLNYYISVINYVTDIPTKELKKVRPYPNKDDIHDISIQTLFEMLSFLLFMPHIETPKPMERIGNYFFTDTTDVQNAIMKDAVFMEYQESNAVTDKFNQLEEGRYEYLALLLAIHYRPKKRENWYRKPTIEEYDTETVRDRAEELKEVDMETVWNCLFFFMQFRKNYLTSIEQSFHQKVAKASQD